MLSSNNGRNRSYSDCSGSARGRIQTQRFMTLMPLFNVITELDNRTGALFSDLINHLDGGANH
jgi:hypothetical protein